MEIMIRHPQMDNDNGSLIFREEKEKEKEEKSAYE